MRIMLAPTIAAAAAIIAAPALAAEPLTSQQHLSGLLRQDASLRAEIGRIQLDALVARVDQTIDRKQRVGDGAAKPIAPQRALDLYVF